MRKFSFGVLVGFVLSVGLVYALFVQEATVPSLYGAQESKEIQELHVEFINLQGEKIGTAILTEESKGVRIQLEAHGLIPGKHGFHIHEHVFQDTDFMSAGDHFNPTGKEHGRLNPKGYHLGDLGNITVQQDGAVQEEIRAADVTLKSGQPHSIRGRSLIIHADEDDEKTDPAGNAGERVAGANIPSPNL